MRKFMILGHKAIYSILTQRVGNRAQLTATSLKTNGP